MSTPEPIAFIDLAAQQKRIGAEINRAIAGVLAHGAYIMGPEVRALERELAAFCGARHAIGCSNGTDALTLAVRALGIGPGDAVFVPAFTFASTAEIVALAGASPVFVDIRVDDFNISADSLSAAIAMTQKQGQLRPAAVITVDLFGQPADYGAIDAIAEEWNLPVIADAAQSFGATYHGRGVGGFGRITTTSFFPAKPLGCYGDGGAVFTDDDALAEVMRSLRVHGKGTDKYDNSRVGLNARLDTLQAAILLEKLKIFPDEIERRNAVAARYSNSLGNRVQTPTLLPGRQSVWAQYTIRTDNRDALQAHLKQAGVPTAVYYPKPLNRQTAYRHHASAPGGTPVSDNCAGDVLSLPMHPYLDAETQDRIVAAIADFQPPR